MRVNKLKYYVSASLVFVLLAATAIHAASMYRLSYVERFETNEVNICIQEISAIENSEDIKQQLAEANEDLSYIPRIINRAADCYVRARVKIDMNGECEQPLGLEHIYGLDEDWIKAGDYFYYTKILAEGQSADLFEGLHVPENWEYGNADGFEIHVEAEAIQSANFNPDFSRDLPWGAVQLETVADATGSEYTEAIPLSVISNVEYKSSGGFQCSTADLFDDFTGMMPGDSIEKTVNLKNSANGTLKTSLKITAEESVLNEKMILTVYSNENEIYSGTVAAASQQTDLAIADIPRGETGNITFRVCLTADADNGLAKVKDDIVWELETEEIPDESVQTGDYSAIIPYAVVAAFALLLMICAIVRDRKDRDEANN